ncbi:MAG: hypothetical protein U9R74_01370 [Pseudomonadota bacterium]|nr:hypothetical protein [Pseudomonadota bacterium]
MTIDLLRAFRFPCLMAGIVLFWGLSFRSMACELETTVSESTPAEVGAFFERQDKDVVTFMGYSGAGYEDEASMLEKAARVLDEFDSSRTIVNIGATPDGIGAVYKLAKRRGFVTTGIVSTQAKKYNAELSPCVDYVFYVEDPIWGGFMDGDRLSPTSSAMVGNSDVLIGIGGGEVARDELLSGRRSGKDVRFIPADMNHEKARDKARKKGMSPPAVFGGAAGEAF